MTIEWSERTHTWVSKWFWLAKDKAQAKVGPGDVKRFGIGKTMDERAGGQQPTRADVARPRCRLPAESPARTPQPPPGPNKNVIPNELTS